MFFSSFDHSKYLSGIIDPQVRRYCLSNYVVYQPYASIRNLGASRLYNQVKNIADKRRVDPQTIVLSFFLQTGAIIIPRASKHEHLVANLALKDEITSKTLELSPAEMSALGWTSDVLSS